ncbi:macro domain-containing protein [Streptomyces tendae]|uniref:macro domain-containing protein n=1 Tax=Streptomyces tendae TaxID=1932 RepID=UPI0033B16EFA
MPHPPHQPDHAAVLAEVRAVRRAGVVRLRGLVVPELLRIARERPDARGESTGPAVERLLRDAVTGIGGGTLQAAAEYTLGLAQGTRDWPPADRRRRAAEVYGVSVERFRKHHELMVLDQVTEQILVLAGPAPAAPPPDEGPAAAGRPGLAAAHRVVEPRVHGRIVPITLHVHSVDLLRDVDVVVSPSNTYFVLPAPYKASVAATLRRAGARTDATGGVVEDRIHDELRDWSARHGVPGRAALPGTVAVTSAGALADQGVRRIYHLAVAVPRPGTNDYDVQPADITRAVDRAFRQLAEESGRHDPPLTSICLPLLGAGRGGLPALESFGALWTAVEAELARGAEWDIHFVVRRHARADLLERLLATAGRRSDGIASAAPGGSV